jgi:hypothetical protein
MGRSEGFVAARACVPAVLTDMLEHQPFTPAKLGFAWQIAVGPALARQTRVVCDGGVLRVRSGDARWSREVERSRAVILSRLDLLLGPNVISELICESPSSLARSAFPPENSSAR